MALATLETIRNRIAVLIEALTPTSLSGDKFRQSRDEAAADFPAWCESNPTACLRRFQVDDDGTDDPPAVSNMDTSKLRATFVVRIAYPNTHRYGGAAGRDRKDVIDEDWRKVNFAIGLYGRANFSGTNDCAPFGATKEVEKGEKVTFLVISSSYEYTLDVDG